jgi:ABC-type phosphate/phosphonate transport system ATPase subunit
MSLVATAQNNGCTIVVATHELSYAADAPRVIALREGSVAYDGDPTATNLHALI